VLNLKLARAWVGIDADTRDFDQKSERVRSKLAGFPDRAVVRFEAETAAATAAIKDLLALIRSVPKRVDVRFNVGAFAGGSRAAADHAAAASTVATGTAMTRVSRQADLAAASLGALARTAGGGGFGPPASTRFRARPFGGFAGQLTDDRVIDTTFRVVSGGGGGALPPPPPGSPGFHSWNQPWPNAGSNAAHTWSPRPGPGWFNPQRFFGGVGAGLGIPGAMLGPQWMAGMAMGSGARFSAETAIEMERQFGTLGRIAGLSAGGVRQLKEELFALGVRSPVPMDDLIQMANIGARAGVHGAGLAKFTEDLSRIKLVLPEIHTEELAERTIRVLNVFGEGTERILGFGSALTALDNATSASGKDIFEITTRLSGMGRAAGLTLPQVMALAATMRDVGLPVESGATAFGRIFVKMANEPAKFAAAAGVSAREFKAAFERDPIEALELLIRKFDELKSKTGGMEFLRKELGFKNQRDIAAFTQIASRFPQINKLAEEASKQTGNPTAIEAASKQLGGDTMAALDQLKNACVELADAMGTPLLGPIKAFAGALTATAGWMRGLMGQPGEAGRKAGFEQVSIHGEATRGFWQGLGQGFGNVGAFVNRQIFGAPKPTKALPQPPGAQPPLAAIPAKNPAPAKVGPQNFREAIGAVPEAERLLSLGMDKFGRALGQIRETKQDLGFAATKGLTALNGLLHKAERPEARAFSSGLDFAHQLQMDILNAQKDKEHLAELRKANTALGAIRDGIKVLAQAPGKVLGAIGDL
jgi:TP901 family phage tail tape measure protein